MKHSRKAHRPDSTPAAVAARPEDRTLERLQKVLAAAGIGSRRQCEELIVSGRVEVDRQTVQQLGCKVDPARQEIRVDGSALPKTRLAYYAVNKPVGVVTTNNDPSGRPRVIDLAPTGERLFPVGRLDVSSEGLILVTNDGELANRLTHPRYGIEKTYQVLVVGVPTPDMLQRLRRGVHLAEGMAHIARVTVKTQHKQSTLLEMVLDEGRNREIRRLLARVGHKVLRLKRTAVGPVRLADLPPGQFRPLRREELRALDQAIRAGRDAAKQSHRSSAPVASESLVAPTGEAAAMSQCRQQQPPTGRPERFSARHDKTPRVSRGQKLRGGGNTQNQSRSGGPRKKFRPGARPTGRPTGGRPMRPAQAGRSVQREQLAEEPVQPKGRRSSSGGARSGGPGGKPRGKSFGNQPRQSKGRRGGARPSDGRPGGARPGGDRPATIIGGETSRTAMRRPKPLGSKVRRSRPKGGRS